MLSPKQSAVKCAEECCKLANQRFHMQQAPNLLNAQVAMLHEALKNADTALISEGYALDGIIRAEIAEALSTTESGWLVKHDREMRDKALGINKRFRTAEV